jgi:hypothetical protein
VSAAGPSRFDPTANEITLNPADLERHWLEEFVHWLQHNNPAMKRAIEEKAFLIARDGPGLPEHATWTARELFAKGYLVANGKALGLGWYDRTFLRLQLRRIKRLGASGGY